MKVMLFKVLCSLAVMGMLFGGCDTEEKKMTTSKQTMETIQETKEKYQPKEVTLVERNTEREYKKYDITYNGTNGLNEVKENEYIEVMVKVGTMRKTGTMGMVIQADCDLGKSEKDKGYPLEICGTAEEFEGVEEGDTLKVQGRYWFGKWTLNLEGENIGAHKVTPSNIYKIN